MPSKQNVERLIELVVSDQTVQAMQEFYADNASMQENNQPPRTGLPQLLEHEHQVLRKFKSIKAQTVEPFFIAGDHAVIHWIFDFTTHDNRRFRLDELAYQTWEGEKIVKEKFYYDPAPQWVGAE
ncbi:nuclear transport factor 2 family protein [Undibacterium terreum]|uniref:Polyketide cyclase n=1 Tax=Undibacterium terreum TaxID=1224302 RepID=A0A916UZI0_9BURK|nr:nuclear transport factor 2 family protein [Undibacterium terreum]GGC95617.1 polyketide cyclase [Undibacterium terreum]